MRLFSNMNLPIATTEKNILPAVLVMAIGRNSAGSSRVILFTPESFQTSVTRLFHGSFTSGWTLSTRSATPKRKEKKLYHQLSNFLDSWDESSLWSTVWWQLGVKRSLVHCQLPSMWKYHHFSGSWSFKGLEVDVIPLSSFEGDSTPKQTSDYPAQRIYRLTGQTL
jgi:hypothetical protein